MFISPQQNRTRINSESSRHLFINRDEHERNEVIHLDRMCVLKVKLDQKSFIIFFPSAGEPTTLCHNVYSFLLSIFIYKMYFLSDQIINPNNRV